MRPDLKDDRTYVAISKALVTAALLTIAVYVWLVVVGDTGLGGM